MTAVFVIVAVFVLAAIPSVLYLSVSKRRSPVTLSVLVGGPLVLALCAAAFVYFQGREYVGWTLHAAWVYMRMVKFPLLVLVVIPIVLYLSVSRRKNRVAQDRHKPLLSVGRIVGEILAGTTTGFAVAVPVVCVILIARADSSKGCFGGFFALAIVLYGFPIVYGPASAVGVYLVGSRGRQTGSFWLTLGCASLGGLAMLVMFPLAYLGPDWLIGVETMVLWALVLLLAPSAATLGFNLTRRYKEPRPS